MEFKYFAIRNHDIIPVRLIERNNRDTGYHVSYKNETILVSDYNLFKTHEQALKELTIRENRINSKNNRITKEIKEITEIVNRIYLDFNISIPVLSLPSSVEDAQKLYNKFKEENERNILSENL